MAIFELHTAELRARIPELSVGDRVLLSGDVYTSRDAAHKRIVALLDDGGELPFPLRDAVIYYAGPTPGRNGMAVGACGPTTSGRMDGFAPRLYDLGVAATIGKGERSVAVRDAIVRNGAVYLCAVGGAGALVARHITGAEEIAFQELGCESVKRLTVESLPLIVAIDAGGGDIFTQGREKYRQTAGKGAVFI
jgi:fumarate hydratase subunit beta